MLNESHIIAFLKQQFPQPGGIGDDAAVLPLSATQSYVITQDLLLEDIHFRKSYTDAPSLAHKALQVNLSDIAAMGAKPLYVLLAIAIPRQTETYSQDFLDHFAKACKKANVTLIGGDTNAAPDKLCLSITIIGTSPTKNLKFRHGARANDIICVVGNLGHAHLGLQALEKNIPKFTRFKEAFLKPKALLHEGAWFGAKPGVTAMMDLSDGLYIDLKRLCQASQITGNIELDLLKTDEEFTIACQKLGLDPCHTQLVGGEDYGLLVTINPDQYPSIATQFAAEFGYNLQKIGILQSGPADVIFTHNDKPVILSLKPFSHFGELG